ncbi:MAG: hypothetical protein LBI72_07795 [Flavobacteriaceae bacterium]|jgi:hypothetical protein|nr:hypothetical protein [Flavobacteriaceae bacterium]
MRTIFLWCLIVVSLSSCTKSDNSKDLVIDNDTPKVSNIGLHQVKIWGLSGGEWFFREKNNKTDYQQAKSDKDLADVYIGLKSATTYEFSYRKSGVFTKPIIITTKALEFNYVSTKETNHCGYFDEHAIQTGRDYFFHMLNALEYDNIDLYLINTSLNDSIKIPTTLRNDKKSLSFIIPEDYGKDKTIKQDVKLGFKVKDKMEYYYNDNYIKNTNQTFSAKNMVPYANYNNEVQQFFIENPQPYIEEVKVVKDVANKYFYFDLIGRFYEVDAKSSTDCNAPAIPYSTTITIYKDDLKSKFLTKSRQLGGVKPPSPPLYSFISEANSNSFLTMPASHLKLYLDEFPKGKYLFQVEVWLLNSHEYKSNVVEIEIDEIKF